MQSRELIKEFEQAGWKLERIKGSHHIFRHPDHKLPLPVPHPKKDLPAGTVRSIKKQAGLI